MRHLSRLQLLDALPASRDRLLAQVADLSDAQWSVPYSAALNPFLWEVGHVGWFMERWCLRGRGHAAPLPAVLLADADRWYDSSRVAHHSRWSLDLPARTAALAYLAQVLEQTLGALARAADNDAALYPFRLVLYHEQMHAEAFAHMRQTAALPAPAAAADPPPAAPAGDAQCAGGEVLIGAPRGAGFVFDNEKWAHPVRLAPFAIARVPVANREFAAFVDDDGYLCRTLWSAPGRAWRDNARATHPAYWQRTGGQWQERRFDRWIALDPQAPVRHVNAFEAEAWCAWAGRRLPREAEHEAAAVLGLITPAGLWEWTASRFEPYPGFAADPYADYSAPWFGSHRSVRGASFVTSALLQHPRLRNFYLPQRADFFVGVRSCALAA